MSYLILPSMRLALYQPANSTLSVLKIRAEGVCLYKPNKVALFFHKNVAVYKSENILHALSHKQPVKAEFKLTFNKKIECLTFSKAGSVVLTDKFGDIYSIDEASNPLSSKYLNSNLGIPTFLESISTADQQLLAIGDEESRLKVYNLQNMHEIISLWFIALKVPLQLIKLQDFLWLLVKTNDQNSKYDSEIIGNAMQVYKIDVKNLQKPDFTGELIHNSPDLNGSCSYRMLTQSSQTNEIYLIELYQQKIQIVELNARQKNITVSIAAGEWDYLSSRVDSNDPSLLIIVYGKDYEYEPPEENQTEEHAILDQIYKRQPSEADPANIQRYTVNKYEHMLIVEMK